jgi:hypothetical protein
MREYISVPLPENVHSEPTKEEIIKAMRSLSEFSQAHTESNSVVSGEVIDSRVERIDPNDTARYTPKPIN